MSMHSRKLDFFKEFLVDSSTVSTSWIDIRPSTSIDANTEVVEFLVPKNSTAFWDLRRSYVEIMAKMVKKDGSKIPIGSRCGIINNLGQTLFRTMEVTLNNHQFGSNPGLHHIRGYLDNFIGMTKDAKDTYLKGEMYFQDSAGEFHDCDPMGGLNKGLQERAIFYADSKVFKLAAALRATCLCKTVTFCLELK